jgi:DNA-binding phage protein
MLKRTDIDEVTFRDWNVVEYLDTPERITGFIKAVIDDGGTEKSIRSAINEALKARAVNQFAEETGIDRKVICQMLYSDGDMQAAKLSSDTMAQILEAFKVPALVKPHNPGNRGYLTESPPTPSNRQESPAILSYHLEGTWHSNKQT